MISNANKKQYDMHSYFALPISIGDAILFKACRFSFNYQFVPNAGVKLDIGHDIVEFIRHRYHAWCACTNWECDEFSHVQVQPSNRAATHRRLMSRQLLYQIKLQFRGFLLVHLRAPTKTSVETSPLVQPARIYMQIAQIRII